LEEHGDNYKKEIPIIVRTAVDSEAKEPIRCAIVIDDARCPYSLCDVQCQQTDSIPKKYRINDVDF
jgi:hypothetical protein